MIANAVLDKGSYSFQKNCYIVLCVDSELKKSNH